MNFSRSLSMTAPALAAALALAACDTAGPTGPETPSHPRAVAAATAALPNLTAYMYVQDYNYNFGPDFRLGTTLVPFSKICNESSVPVGKFPILLLVKQNGLFLSPVEGDYVDGLGAWECEQYYWEQRIAKSTNEFTVLVDYPDNAVKESNENDNSKALTVYGR